MTLPTSNAQSARHLPRRPQMAPPTRSMPPMPQFAAPALPPVPSPAPHALPHSADSAMYEHALGFATHSWDLATGGLKTLTAKRELPAPFERRVREVPAETWNAARNYTLTLVILFCIVLMLLGGGVVLIVMLQP